MSEPATVSRSDLPQPATTPGRSAAPRSSSAVDRSDILRLEAAAALGWQSSDQEKLGDWRLRAEGGFTGRANSVLPLGEAGMSLPEAGAAVRAWYRSRGLPACVAVPFPLAGPGDDPLDAFLAGDGWTIRPGRGIVMTASSTTLRRPGAAVAVTIDERPDEAWFEVYHYRGQPAPPAARRLVMSAPWQAFASVYDGKTIVAIGRVAVAEGWAGLTAMEVVHTHRRRGLASSVIAALADTAADQGAQQLYLQVDDTNTGAQALYARHGFTPRHRYHYRIRAAH